MGRPWISRGRLTIQESAEELLLPRRLDGIRRRAEVQQGQDADARAAIEVPGGTKRCIRAHEVGAIGHSIRYAKIYERRDVSKSKGAIKMIAPIRRGPAGAE